MVENEQGGTPQEARDFKFPTEDKKDEKEETDQTREGESFLQKKPNLPPEFNEEDEREHFRGVPDLVGEIDGMRKILDVNELKAAVLKDPKDKEAQEEVVEYVRKQLGVAETIAREKHLNLSGLTERTPLVPPAFDEEAARDYFLRNKDLPGEINHLEGALKSYNTQSETSPNELIRASAKLRAEYVKNQLQVAQEAAEKRGKDIK
ncbi:MAG: hypothetical protein ABIH38_04130 [Patescibacteria group bacterium]